MVFSFRLFGTKGKRKRRTNQLLARALATLDKHALNVGDVNHSVSSRADLVDALEALEIFSLLRTGYKKSKKNSFPAEDVVSSLTAVIKHSNDPNVTAASLRVLANLSISAGHQPQVLKALIDNGVLELLLQLTTQSQGLDSEDDKIAEKAAQCVSVLCRDGKVATEALKLGAIPTLLEFSKSNSQAELSNVSKEALYNLCTAGERTSDEDFGKEVGEAGEVVVRYLLREKLQGNSLVQEKALKQLENLADKDNFGSLLKEYDAGKIIEEQVLAKGAKKSNKELAKQLLARLNV